MFEGSRVKTPSTLDSSFVTLGPYGPTARSLAQVLLTKGRPDIESKYVYPGCAVKETEALRHEGPRKQGNLCLDAYSGLMKSEPLCGRTQQDLSTFPVFPGLQD